MESVNVTQNNLTILMDVFGTDRKVTRLEVSVHFITTSIRGMFLYSLSSVVHDMPPPFTAYFYNRHPTWMFPIKK